jgi:Co/Zn/Cd efflux system component
VSDCDCGFEAADAAQRQVLRALLGINLAMFVVELGAGLYAESAGLLADALDMLADAMVYAISLAAVGGALAVKARAASLSGWLQILLGAMVAVEVLRRLVYGSEPMSVAMVGVGGLALLANVTCLVLISSHRKGEVHMRASWIFSRNDVIANLGVIVAGVLVAMTASRLPDLVIGAALSLLVIRGGITILGEARSADAGCRT